MPGDFTKIGFVHYLSKIYNNAPSNDTVNEQKFVFFAISAHDNTQGPINIGSYTVSIETDTKMEDPKSFYCDLKKRRLYFIPKAEPEGGL